MSEVATSYPSSTEISREDSKDKVAVVAGAHHPYRFELEDTSSADNSVSSNEENELQEDRLIYCVA